MFTQWNTHMRTRTHQFEQLSVVNFAGTQCGWMSHKENAWAPSLPHGAIGFIVSFCFCHIPTFSCWDKLLAKSCPRYVSFPKVLRSQSYQLESTETDRCVAYLLFSLIYFLPYSHNLEYDSSEEKKPRLIFYNEKDEVVKVRFAFQRHISEVPD